MTLGTTHLRGKSITAPVLLPPDWLIRMPRGPYLVIAINTY